MLAVPIYGGEHTCIKVLCMDADPTGRVGLWTLACWNCGLEFRAGAWMRVLCKCCVIKRFLCRADHSFRGVLPNVLCECDSEA
jgi:hypothetical protein